MQHDDDDDDEDSPSWRTVMMMPLLSEQNQNKDSNVQKCTYMENEQNEELKGGRECEREAGKKGMRREGDEIYVYAILHGFCGR